MVLTRARQRLWLYDDDEAARQPAMDLWGHEGLQLVRVQELTRELIESMQKDSTPEGWVRRGKEVCPTVSKLQVVQATCIRGHKYCVVSSSSPCRRTPRRRDGCAAGKRSVQRFPCEEAYQTVLVAWYPLHKLLPPGKHRRSLPSMQHLGCNWRVQGTEQGMQQAVHAVSK